MTTALVFSARGHRFDPGGRRGKNVGVGTCFEGMTLPSDRESTLCADVKNPTVVYMITCRLSSCKAGVYNIHLFIILERGCRRKYRKKERAVLVNDCHLDVSSIRIRILSTLNPYINPF